eukprot:1139552-Pelagomonas_calceolata.AAC.1
MMGRKRECMPFDSMVFRTNYGKNTPFLFTLGGLKASASLQTFCCLYLKPPLRILHGNHGSTQHFLFIHILIAHATKCLRHMCRPTGLLSISKVYRFT